MADTPEKPALPAPPAARLAPPPFEMVLNVPLGAPPEDGGKVVRMTMSQARFTQNWLTQNLTALENMSPTTPATGRRAAAKRPAPKRKPRKK